MLLPIRLLAKVKTQYISLEMRLFSLGFHVKQNREIYDVNRFDVDPLLRNANKKTLKKFQKFGYIGVKQFDNGKFSLNAHVRGLGGGPILAVTFYWVTKAVYWDGMFAATAGTSVATLAASVSGVGAVVAGIELASCGAAALGMMFYFCKRNHYEL